MMNSVKRALRKSSACGVIFLFSLVVWCASLATPSLSAVLAMPGCAQNSSALGKAGCENPSFLCRFGSSFDPLFGGALISPSAPNFSKDGQPQVGWTVPIGSSYEISLAASGYRAAFPILPIQKVPIYLSHSVLIL